MISPRSRFRHTVGLGPKTRRQNHLIGAHETFYTYAQYAFSSSFYSATNLSAYSIVPSQFTLNLRAGLQWDDGKYDISLYANNATDQKNIYSRALLSIPTHRSISPKRSSSPRRRPLVSP